MLLQVHELSELLIKIQTGRLSWDDIDTSELGYQAAAEQDGGFGDDFEEEVAGGNNHFNNNFTITVVQSKPFNKKRGGRKRR